jgi:hypothetical protein
MTEAILRGEYYYASVEDKPGVLYNVLEHLRQRNVRLLAFTVFPISGGRSQLDFFPIDTDGFLEAAREIGLKLVGPRSAFVIQGKDQASALVAYHKRLAEAGINVHAANGVSDGDGGFGYVLWVKPEDYDEAAKMIGL